ncbi:MAG: exo-alpha-sialidase [Planctomycetes bacterium]|nr:exo-alpha-sialidase [Planctomycetota bacterium]
MSAVVTRIVFLDRIILCMLLVVGTGSIVFRSTCRAHAEENASPKVSQVAQFVLQPKLKQLCLQILRDGMRSDEFWPSIHAAEGLTLAGYGGEVLRFLHPKLKTETDDQKRCGLARELVRAGDKAPVAIMLDILAKDNPYGHSHAAESLYKVAEIGDGHVMRKAFARRNNPVHRIMAAAALGRCGNPAAMQFLRKTAADEDQNNFRIASWVLGRIGDQSDVPQMRNNSKRAEDDLVRCYADHALAALGDAQGQAALSRNLESHDAAIRTYAATFAGDARMTSVAAKLSSLLNDETADVRFRAAQSLLVLTRPAPPDRTENFSVDVFQPTKQNPRNTEGSVIELRDGSLLLAVTEFIDNASDFAKAQIVSRISTDGGRTWGPKRVLQKNVGGLNVMSVTLRRLSNPVRENTPIGFFYLMKNSFDDLRVYMRISHDEAKTFGEPILVTKEKGYHVMNNDRVTLLSSGRLLVPVASTPDVKKVNHFVSFCYLSDDGGKTWRAGKGSVDLPKRGAMEPEVVELNDGRLLMILRTQMGQIATAYSKDEGDTWTKGEPLSVKAPEAPTTIRRIPSTGDLLLIWNNTFSKGTDHGGKRTPLTAAVSSDEGKTWKRIRNLEQRTDQTYAYTSVLFVNHRVLLSYWVQNDGERFYSTRFRSLPMQWFYEKVK